MRSMSLSGELTKADVAKRQLVTAIRLFFEDADPVSVYTLAANAWEIIDTLCTLSGVDSASNQSREHAAGRDLKRDYINSPYRNFFKHADRDPDGTLTGFDDGKNDALLFLAAEDYLRLNSESPLELQVYQMWYLTINREKIAPGALDEVMPAIVSVFPKLREQSRDKQKARGRAVLEDSRQELESIADPRVDKSLW